MKDNKKNKVKKKVTPKQRSNFNRRIEIGKELLKEKELLKHGKIENNNGKLKQNIHFPEQNSRELELRSLLNGLNSDIKYERKNSVKVGIENGWSDNKGFLNEELYKEWLEDQIAKLVRKKENDLAETSFRVKIVGINHSDLPNPFSIIWDLYHNNYPIILEHDPENIYDKFAVKCLIGNKRFGYIQRKDGYENPVAKNIKFLLDNYFAYKVYIEKEFSNFSGFETVYEMSNVQINFYTEEHWSKITIPEISKTVQNILEDTHLKKSKNIENSNLNIKANISSEIKNESNNFSNSRNIPKSIKIPKYEGMGFFYWFLFWDFIFVGLIGLFNFHTLSTVPFLMFMIVCFGIPFLMYKFAKSKK